MHERLISHIILITSRTYFWKKLNSWRGNFFQGMEKKYSQRRSQELYRVWAKIAHFLQIIL